MPGAALVLPVHTGPRSRLTRRRSIGTGAGAVEYDTPTPGLRLVLLHGVNTYLSGLAALHELEQKVLNQL